MGRRATGRTWGRRIASALVPLLLASPVLAAPTPAGTTITNTARLSFGSGSAAASVDSNAVVLTVARVLDVAVVAAVASRPIGSDPQVRVEFQVRNLGNADERFTLSATAVSSLATVAGIVVEGGGASPSASPASTTIDLHAGEARSVVVLVAVPAGTRTDVPVTLAATAQTGHGAPGTVIPGDPAAVVGATGATATARTILTAGAGAAPATGDDADLPVLAKSQSVRAPDGSSRVMPGSVVTYRLAAHFPAATAGVRVDDPIPAGTAYVPGSLTLDGAPLRDAEGVDAAGIHVALGDVAAATDRIIQFQAVIQ